MNAVAVPIHRTIPEALDRAAAGRKVLTFHARVTGRSETVPYRRLRAMALDRARHLAALGPGARVALIAETSPTFLETFYGCQYAGVLPCTLPLTVYFGGRATYVDQLRRRLRAVRPAALLVSDSVLEYASTAASDDGIPVLTYEGLARLPAVDAAEPFAAGDPAYVQFSSGTTSEPSGILVTQSAVAANVSGILTFGLDVRSEDRAFSWLPMCHDMGLVGFSIAPLFGDCAVDYLAPSDFARRPTLWLQLMSELRSTITYAPSFGYRLAAERLGPEIGQIDLSSLRVAGIGGDMIRGDAMAFFAERLAGAGFRSAAFLPSYGLAETTLAATFAVRGEPLEVLHQGRSFVACGRPLPGHDIRLVDAGGDAVAAGEVGEIELRGPSLMAGYIRGGEVDASAISPDGFLATGDLGFMSPDGQLVVSGRRKDVILHRGRTVWPQDIEQAIECAAELRNGDVAAFSVDGAAEETLIVLVQCRMREEARRARLKAQAMATISAASGMVGRVVLVPPGSLPVTSSGKLSRAGARERYVAGLYDSGI